MKRWQGLQPISSWYTRTLSQYTCLWYWPRNWCLVKWWSCDCHVTCALCSDLAQPCHPPDVSRSGKRTNCTPQVCRTPTVKGGGGGRPLPFRSLYVQFFSYLRTYIIYMLTMCVYLYVGRSTFWRMKTWMSTARPTVCYWRTSMRRWGRCYLLCVEESGQTESSVCMHYSYYKYTTKASNPFSFNGTSFLQSSLHNYHWTSLASIWFGAKRFDSSMRIQLSSSVAMYKTGRGARLKERLYKTEGGDI